MWPGTSSVTHRLGSTPEEKTLLGFARRGSFTIAAPSRRRVGLASFWASCLSRPVPYIAVIGRVMTFGLPLMQNTIGDARANRQRSGDVECDGGPTEPGCDRPTRRGRHMSATPPRVLDAGDSRHVQIGCSSANRIAKHVVGARGRVAVLTSTSPRLRPRSPAQAGGNQLRCRPRRLAPLVVLADRQLMLVEAASDFADRVDHLVMAVPPPVPAACTGLFDCFGPSDCPRDRLCRWRLRNVFALPSFIVGNDSHSCRSGRGLV